LQLEAPFNDLFDHARTDDDYGVTGRLSYTDGGQSVTVDSVRVTVRGNTSRRETECAFPKLKVQFPRETRQATPLFAGMSSIKIGTHCGEGAEDGLTARFGRLPNERSPVREAFVYRLLDAVGVPALRARPARATYVYADARPGQSPAQEQPIVRNALLLENTEEAIKRFGGDREIVEKAFTNARAQFTPADTARLALGEAMIGNFDWCLKMTPDDAYRCDARHPLWNIVAGAGAGGRARPLLYDFDVSGMVAGRHPWFTDVFSAEFVPSHSQVDAEVLAQVQRTRSLFARSELDAARREFVKRRPEAYQALDSAVLDTAGKQKAREYLDSFFKAIESDDAFYRPVVVAADTKPYANASRAPVCASRGAIPIGTPVSEPLRTEGGLIQVMVLDALWHWAPPVRCPEIHKGPVWIEAAAVGKDFPK